MNQPEDQDAQQIAEGYAEIQGQSAEITPDGEFSVLPVFAIDSFGLALFSTAQQGQEHTSHEKQP